MSDVQNAPTPARVFAACVAAIRAAELIRRDSSMDKEFHFQKWFAKRLRESRLAFETGGRNKYPDFSLVKFTDGFELKGLAYPGRDASFDSNSQVPTGYHNERTIYYVFGRYPAKPDGNSYPVLDLVICHGDFLNADHDYVHENKNVKGFGSYGDIMIRDRKMYVVPTPFRLIDGAAHAQTLVLPAAVELGLPFEPVGTLARVEAPEMIAGYTFNLATNELIPQRVPNPGAGSLHSFRAWRIAGSPGDPVSLRPVEPPEEELEDQSDSTEAD